MIKFIKFPENIWGTPIKKRDKSSNEDFASKVRISLSLSLSQPLKRDM